MIPTKTKTAKSKVTQTASRILCFYSNPTSQLQIIRISNIPNFWFERVVFPQQRLMFDAVSEAQLEIHTCENGLAMLSDIVSCDRLQVEESLSNNPYSSLLAS